MKRIVFIILAFVTAASFYGCGKKQQSLEEMQQPMSMETLTTMSTTAPSSSEVKAPAPEVKTEAASVLAPASTQAGKLEPLPPAGPYKPTVKEIQTALKNAGFYSGSVDGKLGPNTKKAIIEFQKSQSLVADGKIGPKTWGILSKHLNPETPASAKKR